MVVIIMGSMSDWNVMKECTKVLKQFDISFEVYVSSAHRTPLRTKEIVLDAEQRGADIFIGAAGMAAHLAGGIAAITCKPVIAVPLAGGLLDGLDSLLSSVQMPKEIPVATMAVGKAGAINAGYLSVQILALQPKYANLALKLAQERESKAKQLEQDTQTIQTELQSQ
ncbi:5-(carboxyamino)imidazole ribonucleotide mutase [Helicobacter aurati]|uniref:N5-carboxyaminoimidazole ribonucleotide mutase n=1 Tax=Helicobacter aurati TaxID=137778 RepID=A0A3D8J5A4_9HELI|nr:5-(carboxyamino)imidazole ribonucleotide mutase [Helicobacter aurati]RDU72420.1 5-(carboxyamino)imidazole ribonucleotide mutase [Helicobacter aurati]